MSNRIATSADVTAYSAWTTLAGVPPVQVNDLICDTEDSDFLYHPAASELTLTAEQVTGAASGNNSGDADFVITTTITSSLPSEGVFKVDGGSQTDGFDYYHYSSFSGSTFTLDVTDHPSGLKKTYAGSEDVYISKMRIGATIWADCNPDNDEWEAFRITQLNCGHESYKYMSTIDNPITFRPLNGQFVCHGQSNGAGFFLQDFEHTLYDGENNLYPGLRAPFTTSNFLHNTFGIKLDDTRYNSIPHSIAPDAGINPVSECSIEIVGVETYGNFSSFRIHQGGNASDEIDYALIRVERCYSHDGRDGEGIYAGNTTDRTNDMPRFNKWIIRDNVFARRATESIQITNFSDSSRVSIIENNTIVGGASAWIEPFFIYQDGCYALVFGDGGVIFQNNINEHSVDTFRSMIGAAGFGNSGEVIWRRNVWLYGADILYINANQSDSPNIVYKEEQSWALYPRVDRLRRPQEDDGHLFTYTWSSNNGGNTWKFKHTRSQTGAPDFLDIGDDEQIDHAIDDTTGKPVYQNPGLDYSPTGNDSGGIDYLGLWSDRYFYPRDITSIADNGSGDVLINLEGEHDILTGDSVIIKGTVGYDGYYENAAVRISSTVIHVTGLAFGSSESVGDVGRPSNYLIDEVVNVWETTANGGHQYYKCISAHTTNAASGQEPKNQSSRWLRLYWDVNGIRSDKAGYTGTPDPTTGGLYPPDNYLLEDGNVWNRKGLGISQSPNPSTWSKYKWYIADDAAGTGRELIYGAKDSSIDINDSRYDWISRQTGKYIQGSITPVDENGTSGIETFGTGIIITDVPSHAYSAITEVPLSTTSAPFGHVYALPTSYSAASAASYPVLIHWHGTGEDGNGETPLNDMLTYGPLKILNDGDWPILNGSSEPPAEEFLMFAPQSTTGFPTTSDMDDFVDYIIANYKADPNKIHFMGLSAGSISMWKYYSDVPNKVASMIHVSGRAEGSYLTNICTGKATPVWMFHGESDGVIDYADGLDTFNDLDACTPAVGEIKFTSYPSIAHTGWNKTYDLTGQGDENGSYDAFDISIYDWQLTKTL